MKPRNREVSIFNMSVLDLLTGALGAFCFLTLALFPSYFRAQTGSGPKTDPNAALKAKNEALKEQIENARAEGHRMPPFAMLSISSSNAKNTACATFTLKSLSSPAGAPRMGYRALSPTATGYYGYYLFAVRTGAYRIRVAANLIQTGTCTLEVSTTNTQSRAVDQKVDSSQEVEFVFNVTGEDFPASLFD